METGDAPRDAIQAYQQLKSALAAAELESAKQAYSRVAQLAPPPWGNPNSVSAAFAELGTVLATNDILKARVAFEVLESFLHANVVVAAQRDEAGVEPPRGIGQVAEQRDEAGVKPPRGIGQVGSRREDAGADPPERKKVNIVG